MMMTNNNNNEEYDESNNKDKNNNSGVNFLIPNDEKAATAPKTKRKPAVDIRARGPQFSLADWQRLVRSAKDLAQKKGIPFRKDIPWEEISKHNKEHDCWIVLRGIVYNIGPYLPYHPGGIEIFHNAKNVLGNPDGTRADELFDKYHRYISIEGLIGSLAIGTAAAAAAAAAPPDNINKVENNNTIQEEEDEKGVQQQQQQQR
jgi:hypothetical protein